MFYLLSKGGQQSQGEREGGRCRTWLLAWFCPPVNSDEHSGLAHLGFGAESFHGNQVGVREYENYCVFTESGNLTVVSVGSPQSTRKEVSPHCIDRATESQWGEANVSQDLEAGLSSS